MKKIQSKNSMFLLKKQLEQNIKSIPLKNKQKFGVDLLKLIDKAHEEDYESFEF